MDISPAAIEHILKLLEETPSRLSALSRGLELARLHARPDENTWSASDILAHLRAAADVRGKSILAMIAQDHPTLRYVSPRAWIRKTNYPQLDFRSSLQAFTAQRAQLLATLKSLPVKDWSRGAVFTGTTKGREQTVFSDARRLAQHESEHCEQLEGLLK